ncbi:MAG: MCE family protein [Rhodospirillales bacterium]|nr:MCE family protein [Alphaproteobacteria bacterium]MBL6947704.1 MCE family protein [Rhodospirillales bacterium]
MRSSKINYFVVGLFVMAMIGALIVSIAMLTGRTGAVDKYYTYYYNVTGIKFGTQVVYEGFPIGQLETITPEAKDGRMRFRVDFSVIQGWKIPNDSIVEIAAPGLLAAVTLAIDAGKAKESLKPGQQVVSKERSDVFAVVSNVAGQFGDLMDSNVKPLLDNVNSAVGSINKIIDKEGLSLFEDARKVTKDLSELVAMMSKRVPAIADNIEQFSSKLNVTADEFQKLMTPETRGKIDAVIDNLNKATVSMDALVKDLGGKMGAYDGDVKKALGETRYIVESVSRHIDAINQNMDGAARNMYEFTRQIRQNPGLLLGGKAPEDKGKER